MELILQRVALGAYLIATLLAFASLAPRRRPAAVWTSVSATAGFAFHLASLILRALSENGLPLASLDAILSLATLTAVLAYLYAEWRYRVHAVGVIILPLALLLDLASSLLPTPALPVAARLRDPLLGFHIGVSAIGVGALFLTFAVSVLYLVQERRLKEKMATRAALPLPSLNTCDRVLYLSLLVGFALLTIGLATGAIWSANFRGTFVVWRDHREALALISWAIFAAVLYARLVRGWRGRKTALLTITGFAAVLLRLLGVSLP